MNYAEFKAKEDKRQHEARLQAQRDADKAYNKGLWGALPFWKKHLYFIIRRPDAL